MADDASNIVSFPGTEGQKKTTSAIRNGSSNMRSDLVDAASKVIPEPPVLINLVSARVKQLNLGRAPLIQTDHRMGAADIALTEIIQGKIGVDADSIEE
ncbi:MAG: DNA-directed RNA polymerase subunit omega [Verrucomicrobiales bacterium]|jgi:DNA-directed RNA polymerase subunit omega|nr:DNA-directed RNA polymerase subunit omega [Verrucomicrobiales bacterium]